MSGRRLRLMALVIAVFALSANLAWALGFRLGETKEQLALKYEVSVVDHGTGRITATLTIVDPGRLKPLTSVDLVIPGSESKDGAGPVDLSLALATKEIAGKQTAWIHLKRELAERAEFQLKTESMDGKRQGLTWYYHPIPLAPYLENVRPPKN